MIEGEGYESYDVGCDSCPDVWEFENVWDWPDLMLTLTEAGWDYRKVRGEWKHYCPECVQGVAPYWKHEDALT